MPTKRIVRCRLCRTVILDEPEEYAENDNPLFKHYKKYHTVIYEGSILNVPDKDIREFGFDV